VSNAILGKDFDLGALGSFYVFATIHIFRGSSIVAFFMVKEWV
jgi:hypothetical protein